MTEKVVDIYQPKEKEEKRGGKQSLSKEKLPQHGKQWLLLGVLLVAILGGYFYYTAYQTRITIKPALSTFSEEKDILVRALGSVREGEIRGVMQSKTVAEKREFPIEERRIVEEKTEGEIEVCQDYSDSPANYREGTRFVSDEGKLFLAEEAFVIPARRNNDGCVDVEVIASEAGEEYNVSSDSKFALPGLEGTNIYGRVKGESFTLTKEGSLEEIPYLSEEEMRRVEMEMGEDLLEEGISRMREEYGEDYFLDNNTQFTMDVVERKTEESEEDEESFHFELTVEIKVIATSKEDTENFIKGFLPEGKTWRRETEEVEYKFSRMNFEDREADVVLSFKGEIYEDIDKDSLKRDIVGISFEEAEEKIREKADIEEVEMKNFPFGISRVSGVPERIKISLEFDKN